MKDGAWGSRIAHFGAFAAKTFQKHFADFLVISEWMMLITAGNAAGLRKQPVFVTTRWTVVLASGIIGKLIPIHTVQ